MADLMKMAKALKDYYSQDMKDHETWYKNVMPGMMGKYAFGDVPGYVPIGTSRNVGTPRDTAEEFAGAADWGQRAPADYYRALDNATIYQNLWNSGKNAQDNITQDAAGLALGLCNPNMPKAEIVRQSVRYANTHPFGTEPSFK